MGRQNRLGSACLAEHQAIHLVHLVKNSQLSALETCYIFSTGTGCGTFRYLMHLHGREEGLQGLSKLSLASLVDL